jgi:arsenite methyltransferase
MENEIRERIIGSYSEIATGGRRPCGCCDAAGPAGEAGTRVEPRQIDLGCGTPLEFADLAPGQTVLDLGSGSGREVFLAARAVGDAGRALGLDMTPAMIELARANAAAIGCRNAEFIPGDIGDMPIGTGTVDRVISNCVINLTADKGRVFAEIHRVLRDGGRFAIADIVSTGPLPDEVRSDPELWCACVAGALPVGEYLGAIRGAGFRDVTVVSKQSGSSPGKAGLGLLSITVTGKK